jgi:hypothetical protein
VTGPHDGVTGAATSVTAVLFLQYNTFGVVDFGLADDELWPLDTITWANDLATAMSSGALIRTGMHTGNITVTVGLRDAAPALDTAAWEDVVELSARAPVGQLRVASLDDIPDALPILSAAGAGTYRLRVHARGRRANVDGAAEQPVEKYLLLAWPAPPAPEVVHRRRER